MLALKLDELFAWQRALDLAACPAPATSGRRLDSPRIDRVCWMDVDSSEEQQQQQQQQQQHNTTQHNTTQHNVTQHHTRMFARA
jgi:hypothetical protein